MPEKKEIQEAQTLGHRFPDTFSIKMGLEKCDKEILYRRFLSTIYKIALQIFKKVAKNELEK